MILKVEDEFLTEYNLTNLENEIMDLFKDNPEIDGVFAVNEIYGGNELRKCIDYAIENNIQIKQQGLNNQYYENPQLTIQQMVLTQVQQTVLSILGQ